MAPHLAHMRAGMTVGDIKFIDSMLHDSLTDLLHHESPRH